jgi:ABC-type glutathione transport system ATPase component
MPPLKSPTALRQRLERLMGRRQEREHQAAEVRVRLGKLSGYLAIADKVTDALELLSQRLFALTTLDPVQHRRFLVLDEQDYWLRPDLVPKLVKIVQEAGRALGFQVIMISHHDLSVFEQFADKVCRFVPLLGGVVEVSQVLKPTSNEDLMA